MHSVFLYFCDSKYKVFGNIRYSISEDEGAEHIQGRMAIDWIASENGNNTYLSPIVFSGALEQTVLH